MAKSAVRLVSPFRTHTSYYDHNAKRYVCNRYPWNFRTTNSNCSSRFIMSGDHPSFDDNGDWPRWLLHVDSLTSYPWQPGNRYGSICDPAYSAITYTWGQFQTDVKRVQVLPIQAITWKSDLPRIKEEHFSSEDLHRAIKLAGCPFPGYNKVEFLWIILLASTKHRTLTAFRMIQRRGR